MVNNDKEVKWENERQGGVDVSNRSGLGFDHGFRIGMGCIRAWVIIMIENATLERNHRTGQFSIKVVVSGHELNLWNNIIEHCAESLSNSELRAVYQACSKQITSMNPDDIPFKFQSMMDDLTEALINRKAFISSSSELDPNPKIRR